MTPNEAEKILAENFAPWILDLSPKVTRIAAGEATLEIPITPAIARVGGMVCGQAISALADTSMVIATSAHFGQFQPVATTDLHTQFLRPAKGKVLICDARILKAGRALLVTEATLHTGDKDRPVGKASATFFKP